MGWPVCGLALRTRGRASMNWPPSPSAEQLSRAVEAINQLIIRVRPEQWSAPTPCSAWSVHQLVNHLVAGNLVFAALVSDLAPSERGADHVGDDPPRAYRASAAALQTAFDQPGVLERTYRGPLGAATGAELLLSTQPRTDRFAPAQPVAGDAPAIERLAAFLGRPVSAVDMN